jgi:hypothetical protein
MPKRTPASVVPDPAAALLSRAYGLILSWPCPACGRPFPCACDLGDLAGQGARREDQAPARDQGKTADTPSADSEHDDHGAGDTSAGDAEPTTDGTADAEPSDGR